MTTHIDDSTAETIKIARDRFRDRQNTYLELAAEAKTAKTAMESAQDELNSLLNDALDGQPTLFTDTPEPDSFDLPGEAVEGQLTSDEAATRLDSLVEPAIPPGTLKALAAGGVQTFAEMQEFINQHPNRGLTAIKGVGKAKMDAINAATDAFWARRQAAREQHADFDAEPETETETELDDALELDDEPELAASGVDF